MRGANAVMHIDSTVDGQIKSKMTMQRRIVLVGLLAAAALTVAPTRARSNERRRLPGPIVFPPFELQASGPALRSLASGIAGYAIYVTGKDVASGWIKTHDERVWFVTADSRDLQFKFEVFTLDIASPKDLRARVDAWKPPTIHDDIPQEFRQVLRTRPVVPEPPKTFEPWRSRNGCHVVLRQEFIIDEAAAVPTIGDHPVMQSGGRVVPANASAVCRIAAGVVFEGENGERLLIAVDWNPSILVWTSDATRVDQYLADCTLVPLVDYRPRRTKAGP